MLRRPSPLLAAAIAAAVTILLPVGASARSKCEPRPKPSPAAPLVSIDLSGETVTPASSNVSISPLDYGNEISFAVSSASAQRAYKLSVPLSSDERLTLLSAGGAAITQTLPIPSGDYSGLYPPANYQDDPDPLHDDGTTTTTPGDDTGAVIDDNQDPSWYPSGDDVATATRDGSDIASDALNQVEQQIADGNYVMVAALDSPLATDADGRAVPVSLAKNADGLTVSISPSSSAAFPIKMTLRYGYDPDSYDPPSPDLAATSGSRVKARSATARSMNLKSLLARKAATCSGGAQVVVSYHAGYKYLTDAFKKYPTTCAVYYISVPAPTGTPVSSRTTGAKRVKALNGKLTTKKGLKNYPHWNTSGAEFKPVAEINYMKALKWASNLNRPLTDAANTFAGTMKRNGYGIWSIDEVPCGMLEGDPSQYWTNLRDLVDGLSGSGKVKGILFNCRQKQDDSKSTVASTKSHMKALFSDTANWSTLLSATKFWAQEDYTLCSTVCVGGTSLGKKAMHTNSYMQHPARLAFAPDAPAVAETVQNLFKTRYLPLINGWGAVKEGNSSSNSYGTYNLSTEQIKQLTSLQTYAGRAWVKPANPYSALRIGVRWTDSPQLDNGWNGADRAALARRIARAIAGSYGTNGTASGACDPTGGGNTKLCQPTASGASFTEAWATFRKWNDTTCSPPSNDNFGPNDAQTITGSEDSIGGTTECATWQSGEPDQGTRSVWYRWVAPNAPLSGDYEFVEAFDSHGNLARNVYTGDSLGNLKSAPVGCGIPPDGKTYWIQVVDRYATGEDAPAGPFTLSWNTTGHCYN